MTSVMLATYPEVFAGGAVIAGLPFGVASNVREALNGMFQSPSRPAGELGDLVRSASNHKGPWPKLSVWHGSADRTVNPANANEIVKQWLDVHRSAVGADVGRHVDGYPRQVWWNADGETIVESYTITDMAHGTPLGIADNDERYGAQGAFLIEAGISSSYHIANFFGLTEWIHSAQGSCDAGSAKAKPQGSRQTIPPPRRHPRSPDLAEVLWPLTTTRSPSRAAAQAAASRHRCRRRHHARAHGGGPYEIRASARPARTGKRNARLPRAASGDFVPAWRKYFGTESRAAAVC